MFAFRSSMMMAFSGAMSRCWHTTLYAARSGFRNPCTSPDSSQGPHSYTLATAATSSAVHAGTPTQGTRLWRARNRVRWPKATTDWFPTGAGRQHGCEQASVTQLDSGAKRGQDAQASMQLVCVGRPVRLVRLRRGEGQRKHVKPSAQVVSVSASTSLPERCRSGREPQHALGLRSWKAT